METKHVSGDLTANRSCIKLVIIDISSMTVVIVLVACSMLMFLSVILGWCFLASDADFH